MDWLLITGVVFVGIVCGFINTLAGSGSVISLPLLTFLGLPPTVANGTNRIAILLQSAYGAYRFHKKDLLPVKYSLWLVPVAVAGGAMGAGIAVSLNETMMKYSIAAVLVIMLVVILLKPKQWLKNPKDVVVPSRPSWITLLSFFALGIYAGFIQAGAGVFILILLVLGSGLDVHRSNAIKLLVIAGLNIVALAIFIINDQVDYVWGFILAGGNLIGAWLATHFAMSWGPKVVHYLLIAVIVMSVLKLLDADVYVRLWLGW
jgi:uncharacterized protein